MLVAKYSHWQNRQRYRYCISGSVYCTPYARLSTPLACCPLPSHLPEIVASYGHPIAPDVPGCVRSPAAIRQVLTKPPAYPRGRSITGPPPTTHPDAQDDCLWALAGCRQNDGATGRLLPSESAQVDVTWGSWQIAFCCLGGATCAGCAPPVSCLGEFHLSAQRLHLRRNGSRPNCGRGARMTRLGAVAERRAAGVEAVRPASSSTARGTAERPQGLGRAAPHRQRPRRGLLD